MRRRVQHFRFRQGKAEAEVWATCPVGATFLNGSPIAVNAYARDLPGLDADLAGRRPWYLEDEAEPRVHDAGPELVFALAKRNDVVLPSETWASEDVCLGESFSLQRIAAANG